MGPMPPSVPQLLLPEDANKVATRTDFDWEDIADPGSITYTLQVAFDADFTQLVLTKNGLTASEYTLTNDEKLAQTTKETPYYWRVRAVDSVSNSSEWSVLRSFYIGFSFNMPLWAKYILIGLITLLSLFLCFWGVSYIIYHRDFIDAQSKMSQSSSQISDLKKVDDRN